MSSPRASQHVNASFCTIMRVHLFKNHLQHLPLALEKLEVINAIAEKEFKSCKSFATPMGRLSCTRHSPLE